MELVAKVKDAEHWALLREASDKKLLGARANAIDCSLLLDLSMQCEY